MTIRRASMTTQLLPGLNAVFGKELKRYPEQHKEIFTIETSDRRFEEETKVSDFGPAGTKGEGQPVSYDDAQEAYTARYVHETIALAFSITEEAEEDNLYEKAAKRLTRALARSLAHTKQVKGAAILNNAFDGSVTYGDGVALCSTAHPLVGGGTNANRPTTAADLNETSLEAAIIDISQWLDERGLKINHSVVKAIIPTNLRFVMERLLKSTHRVDSADNDINALHSTNAVPTYAINNYLTDPDAWFLMTDVPDGLKHFIRVAPKKSMDGDFDTGNMKYKVRERYSFGVSDPLGVYGSPGGA